MIRNRNMMNFGRVTSQTNMAALLSAYFIANFPSDFTNSFAKTLRGSFKEQAIPPWYSEVARCEDADYPQSELRQPP